MTVTTRGDVIWRAASGHLHVLSKQLMLEACDSNDNIHLLWVRSKFE
jgi:hypothetical protein